MFHFPRSPPTSLYIQLAVTHHEDEPGFPIRKSSDHSPVIGSPRLIADSHVLHRLLMPRHPPCAPITYTIKKNKNLKSTIKPTPKALIQRKFQKMLVHYIVLKQQPTTQQQHKQKHLHHHHARQTKNNTHVLPPKPNNAPHPTQNQHSTHEQNHPPDTRG